MLLWGSCRKCDDDGGQEDDSHEWQRSCPKDDEALEVGFGPTWVVERTGELDTQSARSEEESIVSDVNHSWMLPPAVCGSDRTRHSCGDWDSASDASEEDPVSALAETGHDSSVLPAILVDPGSAPLNDAAMSQSVQQAPAAAPRKSRKGPRRMSSIREGDEDEDDEEEDEFDFVDEALEEPKLVKQANEVDDASELRWFRMASDGARKHGGNDNAGGHSLGSDGSGLDQYVGSLRGIRGSLGRGGDAIAESGGSFTAPGAPHRAAVPRGSAANFHAPVPRASGVCYAGVESSPYI